jgi:acyl-CoA synthetase (NDP forming)
LLNYSLIYKVVWSEENLDTALKIIEQARTEGRTLLTEIESKELVKFAGINVVETKLATTRDEAVEFAKECGLPVGLKICSVDVVHKSDAGGVKLNLRSEADVAKACDDIIQSVSQKLPEARIQGLTVQPMAKPGVEILIGMSKDPQFGPVIVYGLGGIMVEVIKDVALRIAPLSPRDAREMIREIKGYKILTGYRGQPPVDTATLEKWLVSLSQFVMEHPEIKEIDLNPIFAYPEGAVAVDARVILEKA